MKRLSLILALIVPAMTVFPQTKDSEGHVLASLWKTYETAVKADRPQDQLKALASIKAEAAQKHLAWDWYDAARKTVDVRTSVNWKDRDAARKDMEKELDEFGEPIAVYSYRFWSWNASQASQFVREHKQELQASHNPAFYSGDGSIGGWAKYRPALLPLLKNDYEYTLWSLFLNGRESEIKSYYKDTYPEEAFIGYSDIVSLRGSSSNTPLQEYSRKWEGKAVALMAREQLLRNEYRELTDSRESTQADYQKLRKKGTVFERDRAAFTGTEKRIADCCTAVKSLAEALDGKEITASVEDGLLRLSLRNINSVKVQLCREKETIWETTLKNAAASYYILDTLTKRLPDVDDGEYSLICSSGSVVTDEKYHKHTLSFAFRPDSEGYAAYVADYAGGKPVGACTLELLDADGVLITSVDGFSSADGFGRLPDLIARRLEGAKGYMQLRARYRDEAGRLHSSQCQSISAPVPPRSASGRNVKRAVILTDRSAFNPGETVYFKTICYSGTYEYTTAPAGQTLTACLMDTQEKELASCTLTTNEFGAASASFLIEGGSRGGFYNIKVYDGSTLLAESKIRVDEFVLPTFVLDWDENNSLYLNGDRVSVSGRVRAYSGHSAGGAVLRYSVRMPDGLAERGEMELGADGRFAFSFESQDRYWSWNYPVEVTVSDVTGETLTFGTSVLVYKNLPLLLTIRNDVAGRFTLPEKRSGYGSGMIVRDDFAQVLFETAGKRRESLQISYALYGEDGKKPVLSGKTAGGELVRIPLKGLPSGLYRIEAEAVALCADGHKTTVTGSLGFVKAADDDTALNMEASSFFKELGGEDIALQIGSTDGPVWAVVELFGSGNVLLDRQMLTLKGKKGDNGTLKTVRYSKRPEWPESLVLNVLWFRKGESYRYSRSVNLPEPSISIPLEFTRLTEKLRPGEESVILLKTLPGVECAAAVFDKATETICPNSWEEVRLCRRPASNVYYSISCGADRTYSRIFYSMGTERMLTKNEAVALDDALPAVAEEQAQEAQTIAVRENFSATMAWEPHLRSDAEGLIELPLKGCDRLSTYVVQLFAHSETMHNAVLRGEVLVSIPVKLSLSEPKYLYEGDRYTARVSLASTLEQTLTGRVAIRFYDGTDWRGSRVLATRTARVSLPAGGTVPFDAPFTVPAGIKDLGILVNFVPDSGDGADALFVSVPVREPVQTLTEAHSALLRNPALRGRTIAELRSLFVNMDASALEPQERSILQMVREAIPDMVEPRGKDVMSLTEAYYANVLCRKLGAPGLDDARMAELPGKIAACQNRSGGIAWFEGMESSPVITAAGLQRLAALEDQTAGKLLDVEAAVAYLDDAWFSRADRPWWCGGISLEVYLQTRAMYPSVPFKAPAGKQLREFKKQVKTYLVPGSSRGLNGRILDKARRLHTLRLLAAEPDGAALAKSWGISLKKRILRSIDSDVESLLQYAVEHVSGGCYYPNAVMPWRGLLESEVYAHTILCNLLTPVSSSTGDKIRLWLMVQKETQQWHTDAAYLEALACVLRATPETLDAKVILLSGTYTKPFAQVKAAGNGFTATCKWFVEGRELENGDALHVGDKVTARYSIWSAENRSFVRITAPRPASLRPVEQLSGEYGWWLRPLSYGGWTFSPQGYRNVLSDKTEYWFDTYPEENTAVSEEFFVTQEGAFQTPALEVECLYAPHYRANDSGRNPLLSF